MIDTLEKELVGALRKGVPQAELVWQKVPDTDIKGYLLERAGAIKPLPPHLLESVMSAPPFWSLLWPAGHKLCHMLSKVSLWDARCVDLGCGSGLCSVAAARSGARVLAADTDPLALKATELNAAANSVEIEVSSWWAGEECDTLLLADFLYDDSNLEVLSTLKGFAQEIVVVDSRLKNLSVPDFVHLGDRPGRAVPDLDPHREFGCLKAWYFGPREGQWKSVY